MARAWAWGDRSLRPWARSGMAGAWPSAGAWPGHVGVAGQEDPVSGPLSLSPQGLRRDHPAPCLVCGSLPAAQQCKRCRSFCAAVLQGASFMPLGGGRGGGAWTP